ncbi:hypothetical protein [Streptomyces adonidis]|uniref:hypothetical protein n=1 Tax=Streptomyces adonidis TaxID=3231367 RepID=UPI0034DB2139
MMPGTIAERRTEEVKSPVVAAVDVTHLTYGERVVALYASDMPSRRQGVTQEQVREWIAQGVARLGSAELLRQGAFERGYRLLDGHGLATAQMRAGHEQRFPDARRLKVIVRVVALNVYVDGTSGAALARNRGAEVEGECPCRGTGTIHFTDPRPDFPHGQVCPVHDRATIDWYLGMGR